jgi:cytochrome c-type biogenesis protein CcmF
MSETGTISILLAFAVCVYGAVASIVGAKTKNRDLIRSSENTAIAICVLLLIATLSLIHGLVNLDFSLKYVALNTSTDLPMIYRFTALWAGQAGSLLLWSFVLSIYIAIVVYQNSKARKLMTPYVNATLFSVLIFFLILIAFVESPFEKLSFSAEQGRGLNPILQNAYMAIHPVTLYIGYVGLTIPFAFAMGALLSGRLNDDWIKLCRKWILFSWTFLTIGLLLGARWAYLELGWGGYWAWDPVENAAFMPWLTCTAFLHSIMIQEKRGMLKRWNMVLVTITFFLSIFGTFITRSGIISSVHSFAQSNIGPFFLAFIALILLFSFAMIFYRFDDLKTEARFDSIISRESAFIFNNLLFLGAAFTVFLGTIFPILTEAVQGQKVLVGPPYFNRVNVPIGLVLIFLMGVGPLISWRKASKKNLINNFMYPVILGLFTSVVLVVSGMREITAILAYSLCAFALTTVFSEFIKGTNVRVSRGENYFTAFLKLVSRNKRRYGGYVVHIGVAIIVIGITSSSVFVDTKEATVNPGESFTIGNYTVVYENLHQYSNDAKNGTRADLVLYKNSDRIGYLNPEKNIYKYEGNREINQETEVALRSTFKDDLYIILSNFNEEGTATFRAFLNPMVSWIWAGGIVVLLGAIITMWPTPQLRPQQSFAKYGLGSKDGAVKV